MSAILFLTGSHIAQAVLTFTILPRLVLNLLFSCLISKSAGTKVILKSAVLTWVGFCIWDILAVSVGNEGSRGGVWVLLAA